MAYYFVNTTDPQNINIFSISSLNAHINELHIFEHTLITAPQLQKHSIPNISKNDSSSKIWSYSALVVTALESTKALLRGSQAKILFFFNTSFITEPLQVTLFWVE